MTGYDNDRRFDTNYAPNQWPVNEKADIWGVGKIAHQMIFAHAPDLYEATLGKEARWSGLSRDTQASHLLDWNPRETISDYCSQELYDLVQEMLRHNPEQRPDLDALRTAIYCGLRKHDLKHGREVQLKRKRDIADELQIYPAFEPDEPAGFDKGQVYSPTRKRLRMDINDTATLEQYSQFVDLWNNANSNPSHADQLLVVDAFDAYLVQGEEVELEHDSAEEWTAKHLISCLRKRLDRDTGNIYVLNNPDIDEGPIEDAMSVDSKLEILGYINNDFWNFPSDAPKNARDAFVHAFQWVRWLLENCLVDGEPAEPRGATLTNRSALHQGMYDWIFVKPSGAFQKV